LPTPNEVEAFLNENSQIKNWKNDNNKELIYKKAKEFLSENDVTSAWKTILASKI